MVDYSNIPRDSRRVPLETRVQFKFDRFFGFLSEYSANISPGGMYITTQNPQPPGTVLDLEFSLGDGFQLIQGRGEVIWVRKEDQGNGRPAGMGIRFLELSDGSKELIYRMVDNYVQEGGVPFDLSLVPDEMPPAAKAAFPPSVPPAVDSESFDLSADPFQLEDVEPQPPSLPRQEALVFPDLDDDPFFAKPNAEPEPLPLPGVEPQPEVEPEPEAEPELVPQAPLLEREEFQPARWTTAPPPLEPESPSWSGYQREPETPPSAYLPEPPPPRDAPTPLVHYAGSARATEPRRSAVPWLIVLLVSVAALTAFVVMNEQIMEWAGLAPEAIPAAPTDRSLPRRPGAAASAGPAAAVPTPAAPADTVQPDAAPVVVEEPAGATPPATPAPPAPVPEAPAAAPPPQQQAGPPATAIQRITFERLPTGTEIVLWGNGAIRPDAYKRLRIDGNPPREVIKLTGIQQPFPSPQVRVGTAEVQQVRVGYHPGNELHVVLDLTGARVQAAGFQEDGNRLRILIQRP